MDMDMDMITERRNMDTPMNILNMLVCLLMGLACYELCWLLDLDLLVTELRS
jgi:hypothetical protein